MTEFIHVPCTDPALIAELHGRCFETGWSVKAMTDILAMPGAFCLLGGQEDEIMGFILYRTAADEGEILSMGIVPQHQKKGLGRSLLSATLSHFTTLDIKKAFLEVAEDNPNGQAFYKKLGFEKVGLRKNYYKRKSGKKVDAFILASSCE